MATGNNKEEELPSDGQELPGSEEEERREEVELIPWQRDGVYFLGNRPMRMPAGSNVATGMKS